MRRLNVPFCLLLASFLTIEAFAQTANAVPSVADDFMAAGPAQALPAPIGSAVDGIAAPALGAHIRYLASPALEGRGLGTRGVDAAAEYAAASLALAGIPPLASGYFQDVPLREITGLAGEVAVERRAGDGSRSRAFLSRVDCVFADQEPHTITAPVVFAGYGIREEKLDRDDYRGLDVRGAIVLVLSGVPAGDGWRKPELVSRYASPDAEDRWARKLETARALGAAAVLGVEGDAFAAHDVARDRADARFFLAYDAPAADRATPLVRVSQAVADDLLGTGGRQSQPGRLAGVTATIRVTGAERMVSSRNVVGVLAGTDPKLRDEAVVVGAHMDHLGKVGDAVYPGADDNASGTSALVEIARAFAAAPVRPRRTVVIAFWTGEEEGHLGSAYYVRHPLWPLARTAAYLNLDMIGHPWSMEEIRKLIADNALPDGGAFLAKVKPADFVEPGLPPGAANLESALRRAANATGLALHFDRTDGLHGGSDYREFARAGVPFIRFFGNFFPAYHEPGDTADALDPAQVQKMARLALATAWLLADR